MGPGDNGFLRTNFPLEVSNMLFVSLEGLKKAGFVPFQGSIYIDELFAFLAQFVGGSPRFFQFAFSALIIIDESSNILHLLVNKLF